MAPKESPGKAKVGALSSSILRSLPSVDRLLRSQEGSRLVERFGHALAVESLRATIEARRSELAAGGGGRSPVTNCSWKKLRSGCLNWSNQLSAL